MNWNLHYSITLFPRTNSHAVPRTAGDLIPDSPLSLDNPRMMFESASVFLIEIAQYQPQSRIQARDFQNTIFHAYP